MAEILSKSSCCWATVQRSSCKNSTLERRKRTDLLSSFVDQPAHRTGIIRKDFYGFWAFELF